VVEVGGIRKEEQQAMHFRLMTYNIGGGRKSFDSSTEDAIEVIRKVSPDILAVQEATSWQDADGIWNSTANMIADGAGFGNRFYFGPTLSMQEHMHVKKAIFINAMFNDWRDWVQGNAVFSRWGFARLGNPSKPGMPRNIPLYSPPVYQGNRDTDPRYGVLARVRKLPISPFIFSTHLTTLIGERVREGSPRPVSGKTEEAQILRLKQAKRMLDLLGEHVLEPGEMVFLLGDFNAVASEPCISSVLEANGGFIRLTPTTRPSATHPKALQPIDHIFAYPRNRLLEYQCWIVDTPVARQASDHLPVVADVKVR